MYIICLPKLASFPFYYNLKEKERVFLILLDVFYLPLLKNFFKLAKDQWESYVVLMQFFYPLAVKEIFMEFFVCSHDDLEILDNDLSEEDRF